MVINHIIEDLDTNEHIIEQVKKIIGYCAYKSACHSEYHRYLTYFNKALNFLTYCVLLINISVVFSMNNLVSPYVATIIIATVILFTSIPITFHPAEVAAIANGKPTYPCPIIATVLELTAMTQALLNHF